MHNIFWNVDIEAHLFEINANKRDKGLKNPTLLSYSICSNYQALMSSNKTFFTHSVFPEQHWKTGRKSKGRRVDELFVNIVLQFFFEN